MLSKLATSFVLRSSAPRSVRMTAMMMQRPSHMAYISQRGFFDRLGLENQPSEVAVGGKTGEVSLWQEKAKQQETGLVLKDDD